MAPTLLWSLLLPGSVVRTSPGTPAESQNWGQSSVNPVPKSSDFAGLPLELEVTKLVSLWGSGNALKRLACRQSELQACAPQNLGPLMKNNL